jgi:hypothetical protein
VGIIIGTDITVLVSKDTDVTNLSPVVTVSAEASVSPESGAGKYVALVLPDIVTSIADTEGNTANMYYLSSFTSLKKVSGKGITSIGNGAFAFSVLSNDVPLEEADFPAVTSIGEGAFRQCRVLTTLTLSGEPPALGTSVFSQTNNEDSTLSIKVPSSNAVSAYESAWDVSANTAANGNKNRYGDDHKAINIEAES